MIPHPDEDIVALSTASGPGLRAILRATGPSVVERISPLFTFVSGSSTFATGKLNLPGLSPLPAHFVCRRAPQTQTGQDLIEIQTLGSPPLLERLFATILATGVRPARPGEFLLRAFLAGKIDLTRAEAVQEAVDAETDAELRSAFARMAGGIYDPLTALRSNLLDLLADIEAALDFVDEDIEFVSKTEIRQRLAHADVTLQELRRTLEERGHAGNLPRIVLRGDPNAGKSTLFNALVGSDAALVSDELGTTRDYLQRTIDLNGIECHLVDTAGRDESTEDIASRARELAEAQIQSADLVLHCLPLGSTDLVLKSNEWIVRTKWDLQPEATIVPGEFPVSAVTGKGLPELRAALHDQLARHRRRSSPGVGRCRGRLDLALTALDRAARHAVENDPPELLALTLREALNALGEMTGALHTNDLLDRIFSRFCIGK